MRWAEATLIAIVLIAPTALTNGYGLADIGADQHATSPEYNVDTQFQRSGPPDQSGTLLSECLPECPIGILNAIVHTGSSTSMVQMEGMEKLPVNAEASLVAPGVGAGPRMLYVALFGVPHPNNIPHSPYEAGEVPFGGIPADACAGRTPDADNDGTPDCYLLDPEDVRLYTPEGHVPAVCAYLPNTRLLQPDPAGPCRDVRLEFHEGEDVPGSLPGWYAPLPLVSEVQGEPIVHVVVAPEPSEAPCIEPGFVPDTVPAHDVDELDGLFTLGGPDGFDAAENLTIDTLKFLDGQTEPPLGFQTTQPEPDEPTNGDNTGVLTAASSGPGCTTDGTPTETSAPWQNHIRGPVWMWSGIGWWEPDTPQTALNDHDTDPSVGPVHYISNSYFDDLGIVRDQNGDGRFQCTGTRTNECIPMVWDDERCVELLDVPPNQGCADDLVDQWGLTGPTGLVMVLRANGPLVIWDGQAFVPVPVAQLVQTREYCVVGTSFGLADWDGLDGLLDASCDGIHESLRYVDGDAFRPQAELGEFQGTLRWSWPPGSQFEQIGGTDRLELHYIVTVPFEGATIPGGEPLGLGSHGSGHPAVLSVNGGEGTVTYDWVDVTTIPR